MKLYYMPGACSLADHIVLEWIGKPYRAQKMSREAIKSPEYLALNPAGAVPVLEEDDGWILTQNIAILTYLADSNPKAKLMGDGSPRGRAEVMRWLGFLNSDVHKAFLPIFAPQAFLADASRHEELKENARRTVGTLLGRLDGQLDGHDWLVGSQRSLADPYLLVMLRWADKVAGGLDGFASLKRFHGLIQEDKGVRKVLEEEGLA
ncbi:MAG TPA: glutathione binding-like protein [Rhodanobacteraceae bacterium]|nr:glutathione binding-like protein [Rhodanobacteraceae bacterium]